MYAKLSDGGGVSVTLASLVAVFSVFGCGRLSPGSRAGVVTGAGSLGVRWRVGSSVRLDAP
jgi:hypothetical protein